MLNKGTTSNGTSLTSWINGFYVCLYSDSRRIENLEFLRYNFCLWIKATYVVNHGTSVFYFSTQTTQLKIICPDFDNALPTYEKHKLTARMQRLPVSARLRRQRVVLLFPLVPKAWNTRAKTRRREFVASSEKKTRIKIIILDEY